MERVIYSDFGGLGLILDANDKSEDFIIPKQFTVANEELTPGVMTTLSGFFSKEVEYVGAIKDDESYMVFYTGSDADLFETKRYYYCFFYISNTRIVNKYAPHSARDFNFKNGEWK